MKTAPHRFVPHPFSYHQEVELCIESLSNDGNGIGRVDGWVVFVPYCLPGERVRARVYRNDKNFSRADLVEVLERSERRVEPLCPAFGICGGCQYQHMDYAAQLEWKRKQVADLMRLQIGVEVSVRPPIPSPLQYGYRSKITPHFHKPKDAKMGNIGFLRVDSRSEVCDVTQCPIAMDAINELLPVLRSQVQQAAAQYRRGATLLMRVSGEDGSVLTNPRAVCSEKVGDLTFRFLAGDFFQNNPSILPAFTGYVAQQAGECGARYLVDAYCGSGLFSLCLAEKFEQVVGVEVSESSADWASANASCNGVANARFLSASAEAIFGEISFPPGQTVVVIDPPRKGCDEVFLDQLFQFAPQRVIYVSCNPATHVRDLAEFKRSGYEIAAVQPFDLFPQTKHLECVTTLDRKS